MLHWTESLLPPAATLLDVMTNLNKTGTRIVNICDAENRLIGIITDGDLRRALVKGLGMDTPAKEVMRTNFSFVGSEVPDLALAKMMREKNLLQIPVLDSHKRLVDIKFLTDVIAAAERENWVVLMAGGEGQRLRPLTENTPKPLLEVGGQPLLEHILESFSSLGFHNFFISVNYLANKIIDHMGDGSRFGVNISYLKETEKLGTAGALSLLPKPPSGPLLVMNGDVLTKLNFAALLDFHNLNNAAATMGVREYNWEIPYGVIKTEGNRLTAIVEKPVQQYFVNAGIYVLSPEAVARVPKNRGPFDMPTLFEDLMNQGLTTAAYPIREYWLDIGQPNDLEKANLEYEKLFGGKPNVQKQ